MTEPGWYPDPHGEHQSRYWDGTAWTDHVHDEPLEPPPPTAQPSPLAPSPPRMPAVARPASPPPAAGGSHTGLAWIVALIIVAAVFGITYVIAKAVTDDDDGSSDDVPSISLPADLTLPPLTVPETAPPVPPSEVAPTVIAPTAPTGPAEVQPVVITGAPLAPVAPDGTDPAIGLPAPVIVGAGFDGSPITVAPGAPTLLVFVAHWSPESQAEVAALVAWSQSGQVPPGVSVIGVATNTDGARENYPPSGWLAAAGFPWPVLADSAGSEVATAFGVSTLPYVVMYDAAGSVRFRAGGVIDAGTLAGMIATALG